MEFKINLIKLSKIFSVGSSLYAIQPLCSEITYIYIFGHVACGILVPQTGIESKPSMVKFWSPNHWTAKEVPIKQNCF